MIPRIAIKLLEYDIGVMQTGLKEQDMEKI